MYETVVGLEIHVQLNTASKAFCSDANQFGDEGNTHVSPISLAHPGTLPVLNRAIIERALKLACALGSAINRENRFDRKHYFYPDLPKAYQLTQDHMPICTGGQVNIGSVTKPRYIRIHHVHIEEDAGKSIHHLDERYSFVDLNRAGVPLLEIVTQPDLRSGQEVHDFIARLQQIIRYLDISDANMEEGSMRCDCNVSVRKRGVTKLGERCEIKNLNSKKFAMKAVEYEAKRQVAMIEKGLSIQNTTLHFDTVSGKTYPTREKEGAQDYRYFPDPDLPPIYISHDQIDAIKVEMPALPEEIEHSLMDQYQLSTYQAAILSQDLELVRYFKELAADYGNYPSVANYIINRIIPYTKEKEIPITDFPISHTNSVLLIKLIDDKKLVSSIAFSKVFPEMIAQPGISTIEIVKMLNLESNVDDSLLDTLIREILENHPVEVNKYKSGKKALIGFFIGEGMKKSKGKANPNNLKKKFLEFLKN